MDYISGCIVQAKGKYNDPMIVVSGDFNQWQVGETMSEFVDLSEITGDLQGTTGLLIECSYTLHTEWPERYLHSKQTTALRRVTTR